MDDGVLIGNTTTGDQVLLTNDQRRQHTYIIGVNGTGKTTLLRQIAHSDMGQDPKNGLCVIDPHGDLIDDIIAMVPPQRLDDVILFDPSDEEFPFCLNLFAPVPEPEETGRVASEIVAIFRKIFGGAWTPEIEGVIQNVTLTLLARPRGFPLMGKPWAAAMDEIPALLAMERVSEEDREKPPWKRRVETYRSQFYNLLQQQNQIPVWEFWNYSFDSLTPRPRSELTFAVLNQVRRFLANPTVRNIVAQTESKLDLAEVMNEGRILLVNLSKGQLGEANSAFLGSVIVAKLVVAVFARAKDKLEPRRPFHIIVDEFQNFAISSFPMLLSEARKYNVDLVIAHQYRDQLRDWVQGATVNAGNIVCFRVGGDDALEMAHEFDATPPRAEDEFRPRHRPYVPTEKQRRFLRDVGLAISVIEKVNRGDHVEPSQIAEARQAGQTWLSPGKSALGRYIVDDLNREPFAPTEKTIQTLKRLHAATQSRQRAYLQERVVYPGTPGTFHQSYDADGYYAGESESSETGPVFDRVPGRPRLYSDVYQETANELTHLPNFHARCRLSGSAAAPIEQTFRTIEWPDGHDDATERQRRYDSNVRAIKDNTRDRLTRPRQEVVQDFQTRYEIMLRSIGMTWSRGEPLPRPEIVYEEEA
jgi:hypothetical protein